MGWALLAAFVHALVSAASCSAYYERNIFRRADRLMRGGRKKGCRVYLDIRFIRVTRAIRATWCIRVIRVTTVIRGIRLKQARCTMEK